MAEELIDPHADTPKTLVALCADLERAEAGLLLRDVAGWLSEHCPGVHVAIASGLCHQPRLARELAEAHGAQRLVLGLCSGDYPQTEIEAQARKAGLDPLGIEIVVLGECCRADPLGGEAARVLLAAAVARAQAFSGSSPENTRPVFVWGEKVSRRALFTLPPMRYQPVACIDGGRCAAESGCHLCVLACPQQALGWDGDHVAVEKARCEACGVCLAACPWRAIDLPGHSPAQMEAQLAALLEAVPDGLPQRHILFACQRTLRTWRETGHCPAGQLTVEVPCVGMVPVAALLHCVARGAASVGVAPCQPSCPLGQAEEIKGRLHYCRELLRLLGEPTERIGFVGPGGRPPLAAVARSSGHLQPDSGRKPTPLRLFAPEATVQAVGELAAGHDAPVRLSHAYSPLGVVKFSLERCSQCGVCASACPTGALKLEQAEDGAALTFDARLCVACGQCQALCPEEGALAIDRATDLALLLASRGILYSAGEAKCQVCGAPIAPKAMLQRIERLLGEDTASVSATIGRYCLACRGQRA